MHLIVYGPEGSGKGTQSALLSEKLNIPVFTSGDLVREKAKEKSEIGKICLAALEKGIYVQDDVMFILWKERLSSDKAKRGFILDGFPRNVNQAKFLSEVVKKQSYDIDKFIYIMLDDKEAVKRLVKRKRTIFKGSTISHDTPDRITKRLEEFHKKEIPLVDFFKQRNLLLEIDGAASVESVFKSILKN